MRKHYLLKIICLFYFSFTAITLKAQPAVRTLQQLVAVVDSFNAMLPSEQLYVHFDKTDYATGDTVWFKAYLFQHTTHAYSPLSGVLYVEVISDSNRLIKRLSFPAAFGLSWGQISLDKTEFKEGNYFIRAYTNWMQNFGDEHFYHKAIRLSDPLNENWLITEDHRIVSSPGKNEIDLTLILTGIDHSPENQKPVAVKVVRSKKIIYQQDMETSAAGILKAKFSLPSNTAAKDISIVIEDKANKMRRSIVPLSLNSLQNIDLQFMPESGYMVGGIATKVGFKAIGENGLGIEIQGKIVDSKNVEVASFKSLHRGMGFFQFTPLKNEDYFAVINIEGGNSKRFPLPVVRNTGTVLQFQDEQNSDSIKLMLKASDDLVDNRVYHLVGLSRGVVCYGANIILRNTEVNAMIAKSVFPSGIAHFTLMNPSWQPINERMLFIDHSDNLAIDVRSFKNIFSARDSVPLQIKVTDKEGKGVTGSFSISITDDAQVRTDHLTSENIVSRMLLTAELKGNIEAPDYYSANKNTNAWQALEALLLTQGWMGYEWQKIMKPPPPSFNAEPVFSVRGRVTNVFNAPMNKARVVLMSPGSRLNVRDTTTNKDGEFVFTNFKRLDSLSFLIDARNAKDKKFGITLTVDQFKPAELKPMLFFTPVPWYVNSDSTLVNYALNKQRVEEDLFRSDKFKRLQEVKINVKKVVAGSSNLNGPGQADQVIDEADIEKESGKGKSLLQLLQEKVRGLITQAGDSNMYRVKGYTTFYIIDGISLRNFGPPRETLEYLEVEDIKGIEVLLSPGNTSRYESTFLTLAEQMGQRPVKYVFIEITTRSGNGIFAKKLPGMMIYKPVPVTLPVQFYSPKYTVKNTRDNSRDLRSTVYWHPSLVTNISGEAKTFFYAADKPTTYTLMIQGTDIKGSVGYKVEKMTIK